MSDGVYAPEADSPGAEAARRASSYGLLGKSDRMDIAKSAMRGNRTAEEPGPVGHSVSAEHLDDVTIKTTAVDLLEDAEVRAAGRGLHDERMAELHDELDERISTLASEDTWLQLGAQQGWLDDNFNVTDSADPEWIAIGQQIGCLDEAETDDTDLSDQEIDDLVNQHADWLNAGLQGGWLSEDGELYEGAADPEWIAYGQHVGLLGAA